MNAPLVALAAYFIISIIDSLVNELMPKKVELSTNFKLRQNDVSICIFAIEAIVYLYLMFAFWRLGYYLGHSTSSVQEDGVKCKLGSLAVISLITTY